MEKNEHIVLQDIPSGKNGRFHSALLTTYAIDLVDFDRHIINVLHRKQICSVSVLADQSQLSNAMEYVSPAYMEKVGKEYSIAGIEAKGAFHPKINFMIGDETVIVVFGSGNLTVSGQGKNHEAFTGLWIDGNDETQRPLIEECWRYVSQFISRWGDFERARMLHEVPANCVYLDSDYPVEPHKLWSIKENLSAMLLYNDDTSILSQIAKAVPVDEVVTITVVSPFFDEDGAELIVLAELCKNATVEVLMQNDCELPPYKMESHDRISFYDFDATVRGKVVCRNFDRRLHAKIFHFKTPRQEYCVVGSANATVAGMGTLKRRGLNEEFGIMYVSENGDFLGTLGLKTREVLKVPSKEINNGESKAQVKEYARRKVLGATYESGILKLYCDIPEGIKFFVAVENGSDVCVYEGSFEGEKLAINCKIDGHAAVCYLMNSDKQCVSNKVFVNKIEQLETTNPSQINRKINKVISLIDNLGYDGLEVASMLSDLMDVFMDDAEEATNIHISTTSANARVKEEYLPKITYNEAYDNDDISHSRRGHLDRTSRLIECIEDSIKRRIHFIDEELKDEEESGETEKSNERSELGIDEIEVGERRRAQYYEKNAVALLRKFASLLDKRYLEIGKGMRPFLMKDDLNVFAAVFFAAIEFGYLNRSRYVFTNCDSQTRSLLQKKLYGSLDRIMINEGLSVMEAFARFCQSYMPQSGMVGDFGKKALRTVEYVILYVTLFYKFASDIDEKRYGRRMDDCVRTFFKVLGVPQWDCIKESLAPIAERYHFIFRMEHVERLMQRIGVPIA